MTDITQRPKEAPKPCPAHSIAPRNSKQTLRELVTDYDSRTHLVSLLKRLSPQPKWRERYAFYTANQSGDLGSAKEDFKKMAHKLVADLLAEHARQMSTEE